MFLEVFPNHTQLTVPGKYSSCVLSRIFSLFWFSVCRFSLDLLAMASNFTNGGVHSLDLADLTEQPMQQSVQFHPNNYFRERDEMYKLIIRFVFVCMRGQLSKFANVCRFNSPVNCSTMASRPWRSRWRAWPRSPTCVHPPISSTTLSPNLQKPMEVSS